MKKLLSVILLSASIATTAMAGEHKGDAKDGHRGDGPLPLHKLAKVLDLSETQIEQFKLLKQESQGNHPKWERENSIMDKLAQLDPNANDYTESLNELADLSAEKARERFLMMAEKRAKMREILNPEQLEKLESLQEMREKHFKRRETEG
jgi:periplasmic protein CpxP/Spy